MAEIIASGDWWRLEDDGTLYIYCVGDMPDYDATWDTPWAEYRNGITSIDISDSVTAIGSKSFWDIGLTSVSIGNSVTKINDYAFVSCYNLTNITIPDNVTSIGDMIFHQCDDLTSVTIGVGMAHISDFSFGHAHGLVSINVDSRNLTYSSADGVLFNKSMTELIRFPEGKPGAYRAPGSVANIGFCAFIDCDELISVTLGGNVISIGDSAFFECDNLESVTIPDSVTTIEGDAFHYTNLTDVYYAGTESQWNAITIGEDNDDLTSATIHYNYAPPVTLTSIAITTPPTKTAYVAGETFNASGMVVTATYSDASTAAVVGYSVSPSGNLTANDTTITVSYTESGVTKTATAAITVSEPEPEPEPVAAGRINYTGQSKVIRRLCATVNELYAARPRLFVDTDGYISMDYGEAADNG